MEKTISNVINILTGNGFVLSSSNSQLKKGTLVFKDLFQEGVEYAIYGESGYVRKRNTSDSPKTPSRSMWYTDNRWWQLNKREVIPTRYGNNVKRILVPNDYIGMSNTIIRVAKKSRVINAKI